MKLLYLWISEDKNKVFFNEGFNFGGKYYFEFDQAENEIKVDYKKSYIENFYNFNKNSEYGVTDITAIVGANGSGKTSLLNMLKEIFSGGSMIGIGDVFFEKGIIMILENKELDTIEVIYDGNKFNNILVRPLQEIQCKLELKKFEVRTGEHNFKQVQIDELKNIGNVYFSNAIDYLDGGDCVINGQTIVHDISMNSLLINDIKKINFFSNVNVPEAISKKLQINQIEAYKKYETLRILKFNTKKQELKLPFDLPNRIEIQSRDYRNYNYNIDKEYSIITNLMQKIEGINSFSKDQIEKNRIILNIVFFLVRNIIEYFPFLEYYDNELLRRISIMPDWDYFGLRYESRKELSEYEIREEFNQLKEISEKITKSVLKYANSKQQKLLEELKNSIDIVCDEINEKKMKNYEMEIQNIVEGIGEFDNSNIKKIFEMFDKQWEKVEDCKVNLSLKNSLHYWIHESLEEQIKKVIEYSNVEKACQLIDIIKENILENYNYNYLKNEGINSIFYSPKFIKVETEKIKEIIKLFISTNSNSTGYIELELDKDKEKIQKFTEAYNESNILYQLQELYIQ